MRKDFQVRRILCCVHMLSYAQRAYGLEVHDVEVDDVQRSGKNVCVQTSVDGYVAACYVVLVMHKCVQAFGLWRGKSAERGRRCGMDIELWISD